MIEAYKRYKNKVRRKYFIKWIITILLYTVVLSYSYDLIVWREFNPPWLNFSKLFFLLIALGYLFSIKWRPSMEEIIKNTSQDHKEMAETYLLELRHDKYITKNQKKELLTDEEAKELEEYRLSMEKDISKKRKYEIS